MLNKFLALNYNKDRWIELFLIAHHKNGMRLHK